MEQVWGVFEGLSESLVALGCWRESEMLFSRALHVRKTSHKIQDIYICFSCPYRKGLYREGLSMERQGEGHIFLKVVAFKVIC